MKSSVLFALTAFILSLNAQASQTLEGVWLRPCHTQSLQVQEFSGELSSLTELFFEDASCSSPFLAFFNDGTVQTNQNEMNFKFQKVFIKLYADNLVQDFNQRAVCGIKDWKKSSLQEITGLSCALFQNRKSIQVPRAGDMRYGIWKIENSLLYFGQLTPEKNGLTPEKRPNTWDPRSYKKTNVNILEHDQ